ncbi:hypothetical protein VKT23_008650 [Stygiomarasmius scandens]|uniref:Cytochrome c biogenesis B n=1 Tax=Marasmiellus scandens TaxID=2682957 RepID=A0ABR1JLA8_9AGAR
MLTLLHNWAISRLHGKLSLPHVAGWIRWQAFGHLLLAGLYRVVERRVTEWIFYVVFYSADSEHARSARGLPYYGLSQCIFGIVHLLPPALTDVKQIKCGHPLCLQHSLCPDSLASETQTCSSQVIIFPSFSAVSIWNASFTWFISQAYPSLSITPFATMSSVDTFPPTPSPSPTMHPLRGEYAHPIVDVPFLLLNSFCGALLLVVSSSNDASFTYNPSSSLLLSPAFSRTFNRQHLSFQHLCVSSDPSLLLFTVWLLPL